MDLRGGKLSYPRVTRRGAYAGVRRARRCATPAHPKHQSSWREIRCRNAAAISRTQTIQSSSVVVYLGLPAQTPALSEEITV